MQRLTPQDLIFYFSLRGRQAGNRELGFESRGPALLFWDGEVEWFSLNGTRQKPF